MQTDLNDIQTFVTVAQAGTFSAAAKELGLPTSTISRAITRLEQSIGTMLCQRSPKGLALTDAGSEYLATCKRALRSLRDGRDLIEKHKANPGGLLRVACPITMAKYVLAPALIHFIEKYPSLRVEIDPYSSGWDQEPREDVDVFFKLKAPKDSGRRVRSFPGTVRGLFASADYLAEHEAPKDPLDLLQHRCIGAGPWKLTRGREVATPNIAFHVVASDPSVRLQLVCSNAGIAILPLWIASQPQARVTLVPILPQWKPTPISVCALYTGSVRMTPKVNAFLNFVEEYFGTEQDPRLQGHKPKEFFTDLHLPATEGP